MAKPMFTANSITVWEYVNEHDGEDLTAADIAAGTGLEVKSVNGIVTASFQRKGYMERVPAELELEDGTHKPINLIRLTPEGKKIDIHATKD